MCATAGAQTATEVNNPPSNVPANAPAAYDLIVPVNVQQQGNWCWAATGQMVYEYDSPLPRVLQCQEANALEQEQTGQLQTNCCPSSPTALPVCNQGDGGPLSGYPFTYWYTPPGQALTWDQLLYQIWVVNKPFAFGWAWVGGGGHVQVVTGYSIDSQGGEWVNVNNPEQADPELMTYDEFVADANASTSAPFGGPHTHEQDGYDTTYLLTRPIYNLATNSSTPTNALTVAQAPNLAGTVISDRTVPFTISYAGHSISGTILERVVLETGSQTLDFYYRITNSSTSAGAVVALTTLQSFGGFSVAAGYRTDSSVGTAGAVSATRDISGDTVQINLQAVVPGATSNMILLMTNATTSNDQGAMTIEGLFPGPSKSGINGILTESGVQVATDQPTG
jgi:hypothetical protein